MASLRFTDVQARPTEFLIGDAPTRSLTALAQRLGVSEADAATVVVPLEKPAPGIAVQPQHRCPPLCP